MYDMNLIGSRIRDLRKNRWHLYKENKKRNDNPYKKYSCCKNQSTLAEKLGVERRTIGSWENSKTFPSLKNLIDLSELLECSIEYFLGTGDIPEIGPIAKASHYSGISPKIIRYGLENPFYLDFLNYFMLPENCSDLCNSTSLYAWKTCRINQELSEIKEPLKSTIISAFETFYAVAPFNEINKENYKKFLTAKLPEKKLVFSSKRGEQGINIKACLTLQRYVGLSLSSDTDSRYDDFINFLVEYTYEPLSNNAFLELQKEKLAKTFVSIFTKYISDIKKDFCYDTC